MKYYTFVIAENCPLSPLTRRGSSGYGFIFHDADGTTRYKHEAEKICRETYGGYLPKPDNPDKIHDVKRQQQIQFGKV